MKSTFTILLLLFTILSFAQPVMTIDIVPQTGTSYTAAYNEGTIEVGPSGENKTWDFASLPTAFEINFNILEPEDAPWI